MYSSFDKISSSRILNFSLGMFMKLNF